MIRRAVRAFLTLLAFLAWLFACESVMPEPVRIRAECWEFTCEVWGIGKGWQTWEWLWTSNQLNGALVIQNDVRRPAEYVTDSVMHSFNFTHAAKVPYLFIISIGELSDSLRIVATPDGTTVAK